RKHTVNRHPEKPLGTFRLHFERNFPDQVFQSVYIRPGFNRDREYLCALKKSSFHKTSHVVSHEAQPVLLDKVRLCERNNTILDFQQFAYCKMLPALGHYSFISSDRHQYHINAPGAGQHIFNEPFMARHVDYSNGKFIRVNNTGKPQVYSNTALFLFFKPVGVNSGKCLYKRTLAVINVTRRAEDNIFVTMNGKRIH